MLNWHMQRLKLIRGKTNGWEFKCIQKCIRYLFWIQKGNRIKIARTCKRKREHNKLKKIQINVICENWMWPCKLCKF